MARSIAAASSRAGTTTESRGRERSPAEAGRRGIASRARASIANGTTTARKTSASKIVRASGGVTRAHASPLRSGNAIGGQGTDFPRSRPPRRCAPVRSGPSEGDRPRPSVHHVRNFIRDLCAGWAVRAYAVAVVGAVAVFVGEQIFPDAATKCALADFAWTAAALAAIFGTARAVLRTRDGDRLIWLFFCAGAVSWLAGQLARDLGDVGGLVFSPLWIDAGFMTAAPLWTIALVVLLRLYSNRLALYALALDVAAVVVTVVAGVAMFLSSTLARDLSRDPAASAVAVAYPVLYVAATAAALSVVWGAAPSRPRGALISLFAGLGLNALAFTLYLPGTVQDTFIAGTPLDTLWILGMAAIAIGAAQWTERPDPASAAVDSTSALELSRMLLPGVVAAATAFLLVYTDTTGIRAAEGLVDAAIASAVLILATRAGLALYGNWRLGERERRRAEQLAALYDVGLATAGELGLGELAYLVAREATALTRTDGAMVALAERGKGFVVRAQHNAPAPGPRVSVGES